MLTPQDISDKSFVKAVFGGYDMSGVDDFLEVVSSDYSALYKENAILKGKLKVLVEKVEEYRSTEDAMRMALLTAQRMGEEITVEAARTKEEMLKSADAEVGARMADISKRISSEELRLAAATKETTKFLELSQAIIRKHSEFLKKLETANKAVMPASAPAHEEPLAQQAPPAPAAEAAPILAPTPAPTPLQETLPSPAPAATTSAEFDIDDVAAQIGNAVEQITEEAKPLEEEPPATLFEEEPLKTIETDVTFDIEGSDTITLPVAEEAEEDISPRPKFDFDDLKFGANFDNDD